MLMSMLGHLYGTLSCESGSSRTWIDMLHEVLKWSEVVVIRPPKVRRLALGSGRRMEEAGEHRRYLQYNATQHSTIILISYLHMMYCI